MMTPDEIHLRALAEAYAQLDMARERIRQLEGASRAEDVGSDADSD